MPECVSQSPRHSHDPGTRGNRPAAGLRWRRCLPLPALLLGATSPISGTCVYARRACFPWPGRCTSDGTCPVLNRSLPTYGNPVIQFAAQLGPTVKSTGIIARLRTHEFIALNEHWQDHPVPGCHACVCTDFVLLHPHPVNLRESPRQPR
jgi:hypothetical protein